MPNEAHIIALAGNPNVGKSTVFNALTGLRQHTGNWPGKTVAAARGDLTYGGERFTLVDLPGTYSLFPNSAEEEIARDYLCSGEAEAVLILADATCLERSLNLVLQTLEAADVPAVVCVNLLDRILTWKEERNRLIHALLKQQFAHNEITELAEHGNEIVKVLRTRSGSFNRAVEKARVAK